MVRLSKIMTLKGVEENGAIQFEIHAALRQRVTG